MLFNGLDKNGELTQKLQRLVDSPKDLTTVKMEIAKQLLVAMKSLKISKAEFARRMRKSRAYITQILEGNVNFTVNSLMKITECLSYKFQFRLSNKKTVTSWKLIADYKETIIIRSYTNKDISQEEILAA